MKRILLSIISLLMIFILVSCEFPGFKIKPGDKIGDMQFMDFCEGPNIHEICGGFENLYSGECVVPATNQSFWISTGWDEKTQEELELAWNVMEWKMWFDGRRIDLPSFGTYDFEVEGRKARVWNVCITNPAAGAHMVKYVFENGPVASPEGYGEEIWKFFVADDN